MHVPFVHIRSLGLHLAEDQLRAVELQRRGARVRVLGQWKVSVAERGVTEALRHLAAEIGSSPRRVCTHVAPDLVRFHVLPGATTASWNDSSPGDADVLGDNAWVKAEAGRRLPPGANPDDFIVRHRTLGTELGDGATPEVATPNVVPTTLIAVARRDAVEQRAAALAEVGLSPVFVGAPPLEIACAFAFQPDFVEGVQYVLLSGIRPACLLRYNQGELIELLELDASSPTEALAEAQLLVAQEGASPGDIRIVGAEGDGRDQEKEVGNSERVHSLPVPGGALPGLAPIYAVALALAVRGLYERPGAPSLGLNFLATADTPWEALDRAEAIRTGLVLGAFVFAILLTLTLAGVYLDTRMAEAEAALVPLAGRLAEVEQARATTERLRTDLAEAERLAAERTGSSRHFAHVAAALPDGVWLTGLVLQLGGTDVPLLIARGNATSGESVARFLGRLEEAPPFSEVTLVYAEHVSADETHRQTGQHRVPIRHFEIQAILRPTASSNL